MTVVFEKGTMFSRCVHTQIAGGWRGCHVASKDQTDSGIFDNFLEVLAISGTAFSPMISCPRHLVYICFARGCDHKSLGHYAEVRKEMEPCFQHGTDDVFSICRFPSILSISGVPISVLSGKARSPHSSFRSSRRKAVRPHFA